MLHSLDHHAYGVTETNETVLTRLLSLLEKKEGLSTRGNPDFRLWQHEVMGVDEARELKSAAERKVVGENRRVFIVSSRGITREAQNALLKMLEEPPVGTLFFLLVPSLDLLLPTLRSRLQILEVLSDVPDMDKQLVATFLEGTIPVRLATVQKMLKGLDQEKKAKEGSTGQLSEKGHIMTFLISLERTLAEKDPALVAEALREVLLVKKYSRDRAASLKLLLEHLALVLPRIGENE